MARESHKWRRIGRKLLRWLTSGEVSNCPMCGGTGGPNPRVFNETVYWKGTLVSVCAQCYGAGKV